MGYCCDLLFITTLACQIADCLNENELTILAADIDVLSDSLSAIAVRRSICNTSTDNTIPLNTAACSDESNEVC